MMPKNLKFPTQKENSKKLLSLTSNSKNNNLVKAIIVIKILNRKDQQT